MQRKDTATAATATITATMLTAATIITASQTDRRTHRETQSTARFRNTRRVMSYIVLLPMHTEEDVIGHCSRLCDVIANGIAA